MPKISKKIKKRTWNPILPTIYDFVIKEKEQPEISKIKKSD
jgi:hypothetical protein